MLSHACAKVKTLLQLTGFHLPDKCCWRKNTATFSAFAITHQISAIGCHIMRLMPIFLIRRLLAPMYSSEYTGIDEKIGITFYLLWFITELFSSLSLLYKRKKLIKLSARIEVLQALFKIPNKKVSLHYFEVVILICFILQGIFWFGDSMTILSVAYSCTNIIPILFSFLTYIKFLIAVQQIMMPKYLGHLSAKVIINKTLRDCKDKSSYCLLSLQKEKLEKQTHEHFLGCETAQRYLDDTVDLLMETFGLSLLILILGNFLHVMMETYNMIIRTTSIPIVNIRKITIFVRIAVIWLCVDLETKIKQTVSSFEIV